MVTRAQYEALKASAELLQTSPRRVHDLLRTGIRDGLIAEDDQLVEDFLVRSLATSRNAVREALQMLAAEGLVRRERRVGTTVVGRPLRIPLDDIVSDTATGVSVVRLEDREVPSTALIRDRLGVHGARVGMIEHLFSHRGHPIGIRVAYYRSGVVQPLGWDGAPDTASAFLEVFGIPLGRVVTTVDAIPCESRTSRLLDVEVGSPVLVREQLLIDASDVVQEFAYTHYRADRVSFSVSAGTTPPLDGVPCATGRLASGEGAGRLTSGPSRLARPRWAPGLNLPGGTEASAGLTGQPASGC